MVPKKAMKKAEQQILSFYLRARRKYADGVGKRYWTATHLEWLRKLDLSPAMREIFDEYLDTYGKYESKIERLDGRLLERSNSERYKEVTRQAQLPKGRQPGRAR